MTSSQTEQSGRRAARTTANPYQSMKSAYGVAIADEGPMDWMAWTLGYIKELMGR
jgi:hypothetical protein